MRHILVTGGAGFLGIFLIRELRRRGLGVLVVDDGSAGTWDRLAEFMCDPGVRGYQADLCDPSALRAAWPSQGVVGVVHLAARHFIPYCQQNPDETWQINVRGTRNLLAVAAERPPARLLLASTADVYAPSDDPFHENSETGPTSIYGQSKLEAETLVEDFSQAQGIPSVIARLFNLYGPGPTVPHLAASVIEQAARSDRLLLGNLESVRDYVYVGDAAEALAELLVLPADGVFNIGTGAATSGHQIVGQVAEILGRPLEVVTDSARLRDPDRPYLICAPDRLRSFLGHWPFTSLALGLRAAVNLSQRHGVVEGAHEPATTAWPVD